MRVRRGDYVRELYGLMSKFETDVRPLVELFAILAGFKPDIIQGLGRCFDLLEALSPPAELKQDHERLLAYLEQQLEAARLIPDQPTNTLFVGQGPPRGRIGAPPECVAAEFSEAFLRLVAVHFGEPRADCPPPGPPP
jgi:hypothetical protein